MMKRILSIILSLTIAFSMTACGLDLNLGSSDTLEVELEDYEAPVEEESSIIETEDLTYPIILKLGCAFDDNHPLMPVLKEFADTVKTGTNSNVIIQIYNDETLGGDSELINKVETGDVDMALASCSVYANKVPASSASALPFVFDTSDVAWDFIKQYTKEQVADSFNDYSLHYLTTLDNGYKAVFTSADAGPVREADDLRTMMIATTGGQVSLEILDELYATAIYTASEKTAEEEIVANKLSGIEYSLADAYYSEVYEYTKFVALTDHSYDSYILSINEYIWKNMESDYRDVINKALVGMDDESHEIMTVENENCLNLLRDRGMIVSDPKMALYFRHTAYDVITMYVKLYSTDLRNLIVNYKRKSTLIVDEGESTIDDYDESLYEKSEDLEVDENGYLK